MSEESRATPGTWEAIVEAGHLALTEQNLQNALLRQRIATLEAMVEEALRIFDLHLNTPETQALRAQWKEMKEP